MKDFLPFPVVILLFLTACSSNYSNDQLVRNWHSEEWQPPYFFGRKGQIGIIKEGDEIDSSKAPTLRESKSKSHRRRLATDKTDRQ